jgi:hypothetical protein
MNSQNQIFINIESAESASPKKDKNPFSIFMDEITPKQKTPDKKASNANILSRMILDK